MRSLFLLPICCAHLLSAQGPAPVGLPRNTTSVRLGPTRDPRDSLFAIAAFAWNNDSASRSSAFAAGDTEKGSQWKTGMLIGGGVGLFLAYAFSTTSVEQSRSTGEKVRGWVLPVAIFSMAGGLIGSLFPSGGP